jgi:CRISPR system Cascade subunit CasA
MNLLFDPWIPVQKDNIHRHITLKELLCHEENWTVSLPRDDLEMACLQLLIALTQALFIPKDFDVWLQRQETPLTGAEYDQQAHRYMDWFGLDHVIQPFMQRRDVKAEKVTPIQKLFVGLPEGENHAFFNPIGEIAAACGSCVAIALFNQAVSALNIGGGFKAGLRGNAPITTLIHADNLRRMVWRNVLHKDSLDAFFPGWRNLDQQDEPVWRNPIQQRQKIFWSEIGLKRGLFWQPVKLVLCSPEPATRCGCCGVQTEEGYTGIYKDKFDFTVDGQWPHPLSPRKWTVKKGEQQESFLSFKTTAPAWTQLTQFVIEKQEEKEGNSPAPVVTQFGNLQSYGEPLYLLAGGYLNEPGKSSKLAERRHELFNLAAGWIEHKSDIEKIVSLALQGRDALYGALVKFFEKVKDLNTKAKESKLSEGMRKTAIVSRSRNDE